MKSNSKKDFVLITNVEKNKFYNRLKKETNFDQDKRIKFVGTVYNQELLKYIRENAYAYFHGHEVGGTNPSLLESLASTKLNLLLDVGFNREVARDGALYWKKEFLSELIDNSEKKYDVNTSFNNSFQEYFRKEFSWDNVTSLYEQLWREV